MSSVSRGFALVLVVACAGCASRTSHVAAPVRPAAAGHAAATAAVFERLRDKPVLRRVFLRDLPKGGDLHVHVSGSIYAETFVRWASEDGLCLDIARTAFTRPPCDAPLVPAARVLADDHLHDTVIDALSMRNWHATRTSGHAQFFDAFSKFSAATRGRVGDMLAEITSRAAAQHVSYVELMSPVDDGTARRLGAEVAWTGDMVAMREALLAAGLRDDLQRARRTLDAAEARQRDLLRCGTAQADAGCAVTIRYLLPALRASSPGDVFTQFLTGFEMTTLDPRVVGVNIAQPEDGPVALRDFTLHMSMLDWLHAQYPKAGIALHAGEFVEGLVPPEALRFHIRASIEQGHARRIGHGVAIRHEDDALGLLRKMAKEQVAVEVALSSNDGILGVRGLDHPLNAYLAFGVPITLATDDEGVSRSQLTREYERAAVEHGLDYPTLKAIARNSLQHAFVEAAEKARLLREFDAAIVAFEARWADPATIRP